MPAFFKININGSIKKNEGISIWLAYATGFNIVRMWWGWWRWFIKAGIYPLVIGGQQLFILLQCCGGESINN
ncbi:MAG: hypothetical protein B0W54_17145 [Cellvibrio sp. 79]|nr:MAG: hypothetical protein B0W54_17145 [Cellvibrio sp. 79]